MDGSFNRRSHQAVYARKGWVTGRTNATGTLRLAEESGITPSMASKILNNEVKDIETATSVKIAVALGVSLDWMLLGRESQIDDVAAEVRELRAAVDAALSKPKSAPPPDHSTVVPVVAPKRILPKTHR